MTAKILPFVKPEPKKPKPEGEFSLATTLGIDKYPPSDTDTDGTTWPPADMLAPCDTEPSSG